MGRHIHPGQRAPLPWRWWPGPPVGLGHPGDTGVIGRITHGNCVLELGGKGANNVQNNPGPDATHWFDWARPVSGEGPGCEATERMSVMLTQQPLAENYQDMDHGYGFIFSGPPQSVPAH